MQTDVLRVGVVLPAPAGFGERRQGDRRRPPLGEVATARSTPGVAKAPTVLPPRLNPRIAPRCRRPRVLGSIDRRCSQHAAPLSCTVLPAMRRDPKAQTSRLGVLAVQRVIVSELEWVFREQSVEDFGIDAHIEVVEDGECHGALIAAQIKSGPSYFTERSAEGYIFRGDQKHLDYWLRHSLPVIIALVNDDGEVVWEHVTPERVSFTEKGWKITVPFGQRLEESAAHLARVASRAPTPPTAVPRRHPSLRKGANALLTNLHRPGETLTECLIEVLEFAQDNGQTDLAFFCQKELAGYAIGDDIPEYRRLDGFVANAPANGSMDGATSVAATLGLFNQYPDYFTWSTITLLNPIPELERVTMSLGPKRLFQYEQPCDESPSGMLYFYADPQEPLTLLAKVRTSLTRLLLSAAGV